MKVTAWPNVGVVFEAVTDVIVAVVTSAGSRVFELLRKSGESLV